MKIVIALLATLILASSFASACSCIALQTTQDRYDAAQVVMLGKAIRVDKEISLTAQGNQEVTFAVEKSWKAGNQTLKEKVEIEAPEDNGANCGFTFKEDEEYLIYGHYSEEEGDMMLTTSACSHNLLKSEASEEIATLDTIAPQVQPEAQSLDGFFNRILAWLEKKFIK